VDKQRQVAVFLTAIPDEYKAVRVFIEDPEEQEHKGTLFECGAFAPDGIEPWQVVVAELGEGTENAATLTERAIEHFDPSHVFFIGVAGGVKDVELGDVVAATKVYGYESGKDEATFRPRPDLGHATHAMEQRARAVSRSDAWANRIRPRPTAPPVSLVKPIASGNKVVADTRSATYGFIRSQYGDAVAVEMEGIGFFKAVKASTGIEAIEIRGISDLIDQKAQADQAGWQPKAAAHAAAFAFEMLARMGRPKVPVEEPTGTRVPPTSFDAIIEENLRQAFATPGLGPFSESLLAEAAIRRPAVGRTDPVDLLCDPDLQLDQAIAWLTRAVRRTLKTLRRHQSAALPELKRDVTEVLGWLVLRAVDETWLSAHAGNLKRSEGARVRVALKHVSCVEILLSRAHERAAEFRLGGQGDLVLGRHGVTCGSEGGIAAPANELEILKAIWREVMRSPVPERFSDDHERTLAARLRAQALADRPHYLTVPLDDLKAPLGEADLDRLQAKFPYLKLIFIRTGDAGSALLLDEFGLDGQLHAFLQTLGETP